MPVKPPALKHTTDDLGDKLVITIPSGRSLFAGIVRCLWLAFYVVCEAFFIYILMISLAEQPQPPLYFTIMMLAVIVFFAGFTAAYAYALFWEFYGKEIVQITKLSLTLNRNILGRSSPREYSAESIKDLRTVPASIARNRPGFTLISSSLFPMARATIGSLCFDYGAKTFEFGAGIDEAEAKQIVAEIKQKFPQYRSNGA